MKSKYGIAPVIIVLDDFKDLSILDILVEKECPNVDCSEIAGGGVSH